MSTTEDTWTGQELESEEEGAIITEAGNNALLVDGEGNSVVTDYAPEVGGPSPRFAKKFLDDDGNYIGPDSELEGLYDQLCEWHDYVTSLHETPTNYREGEWQSYVENIERKISHLEGKIG